MGVVWHGGVGRGEATEPALGCFTYRGGTADRKQVEYASIVYIG